jgi:hypothetical protein
MPVRLNGVLRAVDLKILQHPRNFSERRNFVLDNASDELDERGGRDLNVETDVPRDPDYYAGWSSTITTYSGQVSEGGVKFKPAICANTRDDPT